MSLFAKDILDLAGSVLNTCRVRDLKITTAESCTGGLIAACFTEISGSSDVFDRGFVTYSNQAKQESLGVRTETLAQYGAVSKETALEMAQGALAHSKAQISISVTGIAGPSGGSVEKPVGLVYVVIANVNGTTLHKECRFGDIGRGNIRVETLRISLALASKFTMEPI